MTNTICHKHYSAIRQYARIAKENSFMESDKQITERVSKVFELMFNEPYEQHYLPAVNEGIFEAIQNKEEVFLIE